MLETKKISVVTVVRKGSRFYQSAIRSFFAQNYQNKEWLIIDNTGKDVLRTKLYKYTQKNQQIKIIPNSQPLQNIDLLKQIFHQTSGSYIAFLKPEDYWHIEKLLS